MAIFEGTEGDDVLPPMGGDNSGDDTFNGFGGDDTLDGGTGEDVMNGGAGNDMIDGGIGDDVLHGDAGNDTLLALIDFGPELPTPWNTYDGGDGFDILDYSPTVYMIYVDLTTGRGGIFDYEVFPGTDVYVSIEGVIGTSNGDTLIGDVRSNRLEGGAGNDLLRGNAGGDTLDGGAGVDTASYYGNHGGIGVNLTTGKSSDGDTLISIENVFGSSYADILTGDAASNSLFGKDGNDLLKGGAGGDSLYGDGGADTVSYADAPGGIGLNLTTGKSSDGDTLYFIENLTGSAYGDYLTGNNAFNTLVGGGGRDILTGGTGTDTFKFLSISDSKIGAANRDLITDFRHSSLDKIDLSAIDAKGNVAGEQAFTFLGTGAFTGVSGQLHYWHEGSQTIVSGDVNGDRVADFNIALQGTLTLVAGDFVL